MLPLRRSASSALVGLLVAGFAIGASGLVDAPARDFGALAAGQPGIGSARATCSPS